MPTKQALLSEIDATDPAPGAMVCWWLGQHGFVFKCGATVIYLDAFLSEHPRRLVPPLLDPSTITHADLFIGTHDHTDHIDRKIWPALAQASPRAQFAVPGILVEKVSRELSIPLERFIPLDDMKAFELGGVRFTALASAHELLDPDPASGRFPCMGIVLETPACRLYHSGDCCIYEGLETKLKAWSLDGVFLPINGRSGAQLRSRIVGNMTWQEAVDLAGKIKARAAVPTHFEMFDGNKGDPNLFVDYLEVKFPLVKAIVPSHGQAMHFPLR